MVFEYTPMEDALCESFWTFSIPSQSIAAPFLLVGAVSEPRVMFDRPSLAFGRVQLGVRGKLPLAIVNEEILPFSFTLSKASYDAAPELLAAAGGGAALQFSPDSGTVPPGGKVGGALTVLLRVLAAVLVARLGLVPRFTGLHVAPI